MIDGFGDEKSARFESQSCPLHPLGKKEKRFKLMVPFKFTVIMRYDGPMEWFTELKVY